MSLLKCIENLNTLPFSVFQTRFFDTYDEYFKLEIEKLKKLTPKNITDKSINENTLEFLEFIKEKILFNKNDVEIIKECTKFLFFLDSEFIILKLEIKRLLNEDNFFLEEIKKFENKKNIIKKNIIKTETELNCLKAILRMRNINIIPQKNDYDIKFCLDDSENIEENPSNLIKPIFLIYKDFLHEGKYSLAIEFLTETIKNLTKPNQITVDLAFLHGYLAHVFYIDCDYIHAIENYKISLKYRETLVTSDDPIIGTLLFNYSLALLKNKNIKELIITLNRTLIIKEKELGNEHLLLAKIHSFLGQVLDLEKNFSETIKHYIISLKILNKLNLITTPFYVGVSISLCKMYLKTKQKKLIEPILLNLFKELHEKFECKKVETVYEYLMKSLNDANGEYIYRGYGNIELYDICNLIEFIVEYFTPFPVIMKSIDTWKLFSLRRL